jgi:hypothetical protein
MISAKFDFQSNLRLSVDGVDFPCRGSLDSPAARFDLDDLHELRIYGVPLLLVDLQEYIRMRVKPKPETQCDSTSSHSPKPNTPEDNLGSGCCYRSMILYACNSWRMMEGDRD